VLALVEAATKRLDDLRIAATDYSNLQHRHQQEMAAQRAEHEQIVGALREGYQEKISHAESGRLDSIRQVDREEVAKTAVAANTAITTLAKQTTDLQQTLAKQVTDTAAAQESRNSAQYSDINKRLSALELSSSEGKGKQTVVDPQIDRITVLVETLARNQAAGVGKSEGISASWGVLLGGAGLAVAILIAVLSMGKSQPQPQVVYVPTQAQQPAPTSTTTVVTKP
jgi:hypothetical protein